MSKREISFKGRIAQAKAIAYIEELLNGLKNDALYVQNDDEYVALKPTDDVLFEVEASQKKGKERLSIELTWTQPEPMEEETGLRILTSEPEIKQEIEREEQQA